MAYGGRKRELEQREAEAPSTGLAVVVSVGGGLRRRRLSDLAQVAGRGALLCVAGSGAISYKRAAIRSSSACRRRSGAPCSTRPWASSVALV